MHLHELSEVELGLLEHLNLADVDVLQREDGLALLLNLGANGLGEGDAARFDEKRKKEIRGEQSVERTGRKQQQ